MLFNGDDLLRVIKKSAVDAVNASKPANVVFGKVICECPLKIQVDQKLILTSAMLVLSRNVTDFKVEMTVEHETEEEKGGFGELAFANHKHAYKGRKEFLVQNALKTGDEVILMRVSGGQMYVVLDRKEGG